jgi:hypothetical protein
MKVLVRRGNLIPKPVLHQTQLEKEVFEGIKEVENAKQLKLLLKQKITNWIIQALFTSRRIVGKYDLGNVIFVYNVNKRPLDGLEERRLDRSRLFSISLYLLEFFGEHFDLRRFSPEYPRDR